MLFRDLLLVLAVVIVPIIALTDIGGIVPSMQIIKEFNADLLSFLGKKIFWLLFL
ncbi:hypothetical protein [Bacteroidetes bacterium endosymbiont of Geopemphigus sp.]|uniref:hypothetical protein n=1 Tax=Bacteroidetes bacterium endosymbiont of Geopemphigus sp. TaxID=2047937 RepID=UPI001F4DC2DD|nr:hypothetical protein [Bacteroidetes bacterium endosymbiont of Geopemphigus sp.]